MKPKAGEEKKETHEYLKEQNEKLLIKNNSEGYQSQINYEENQEEVFHTNTFVHGSFDEEELEECNENGYVKEKDVSQNEHPMVTVENEPNRIESVSTITDRSFQSNLENYTKRQLFEYIVEIKKRKQDVIDEQEEINAMTLGQVVKCAKYDLFKKVQFIRHKKILDEYESRGSIGRFVMKKLKIKKERRKRFWHTYRQMVRKGIKCQRNVILTNIRRRFLGKVSKQ